MSGGFLWAGTKEKANQMTPFLSLISFHCDESGCLGITNHGPKPSETMSHNKPLCLCAVYVRLLCHRDKII